MPAWLPWIALFGPFAVAAIVLVAARLPVSGRAARPTTDDLEIHPPVLPEAPRAAGRRFRVSLSRLSHRPAKVVEDGWHDALEEASKSLGSRYPYLGTT